MAHGHLILFWAWYNKHKQELIPSCFMFTSGPIPNDTIGRGSRKFQNEHVESKGDSSLSNVPWVDRESNAMTERTSSAQSVATTSKEKPKPSVEKVPAQDGCAVIDNGSFSVPNSSKPSMSKDAGLPQMSPQKGGAMKQNLSAKVQDSKASPPVQVSKCKYVQQFTMVKPVDCALF